MTVDILGKATFRITAYPESGSYGKVEVTSLPSWRLPPTATERLHPWHLSL